MFALWAFGGLLFLFGLVTGSFLNVVIDRGVKGQSLIKKRSHCDYCQKTLSVFDLIPVISYLLLQGKCRYCHHGLSPQYPLVELSTAILLPLTFLLSSAIPTFPVFVTTGYHSFYLLLVVIFFLVIFVIDIKHQLILENIINSAILTTVFYYLGLLVIYFVNSPVFFTALMDRVISALLSGLSVSLLFRLLIIVSHGRGLGEGDIKLGFWLGLLLGFPNVLPGLFLSFILGAGISILLVISDKKKFGQTVPLAPFLITGSYISLFWGQEILSWYLKTFL